MSVGYGGVRKVRSQFGLFALVACLVAAAGLMPSHAPAKPKPRNAEELLIVDCLLPGQIRKLGAQASFMSARRPIRTTEADCQIRGGEYVAYDRANYQTALKVWMDSAMGGDAQAQNMVGEIYSKGLGTAPDYAMAALWFRKAADQGNSRAKINLGYLYEEGLGVEKDVTQALNLYRAASGIQNDDLLFASAVRLEMQAKDTRIGELQQTVEQQQQENAAQREELSRLRGQLDSRKRELENSRRELGQARARLEQTSAASSEEFAKLDKLRAELAEQSARVQGESERLREQQGQQAMRTMQMEQQLQTLRQQEKQISARNDAQALAKVKAQADEIATAQANVQAQVQRLQAQLAEREAALAQQKQQYESEIERLAAGQDGRQKEDWELMKLLENQLLAKESELRNQQARVAQLERAGGGSVTLAAAGAPMLEIIQPALTLTRGAPAAMLRSGPGRQMVVGKVSAPQGVKSVTLNGVPAQLSGDGSFRSSVEVAAGGTPVKVAALDGRNRTAELEFTLVPQAGAAAPVASTTVKPGAIPRGVELGRFHAIVIGNNTYGSEQFPTLQSAITDATAVAQLLRERYGYEVQLLLNATRMDLLTALGEARAKLKPQDNLLVYYAGHGELSADGKEGYWIPVDGLPNAPQTWISNGAISSILETMESRHVLVVADSCYSGSMTRSAMASFENATMPADAWGEWVKTMNAGRSRTALTSGGLQPVPDTGSGKHSYFARAFLNVLQDNNRVLEAQRLYREIGSTLALASLDAPITQVPEYSPIRFAGHEAGEFFFVPKGAVKVAMR
ncbi:MAG: caspase family protein [Lysobacteraceae bacterium]